MKALSLHQPWASLMAQGLKTIETRGWKTDYRGDLAICAGKRLPTLEEFGGSKEDYGAMLCHTPFGKVVCVVELYDCWTSEVLTKVRHKMNAGEWELGNYEPGRWGWLTRNLRPLRLPVPVRGMQSLFDLPPDVEAAVRRQLATMQPASVAVESPFVQQEQIIEGN